MLCYVFANSSQFQSMDSHTRVLKPSETIYKLPIALVIKNTIEVGTKNNLDILDQQPSPGQH